MAKKSKLHITEKEKVVIKYLNQEINFYFIKMHFKISHDRFRKWVRRYQAHGITGLKDNNCWNNYSEILKIQKEYLVFLSFFSLTTPENAKNNIKVKKNKFIKI